MFPETTSVPPSADVAALDQATPDEPAPAAPPFVRALVPRLTLRVTYFTGSSALALYPESAVERWQWPVSQGLTVELRLLWTLDGATSDRDESVAGSR